MNKSKKHFNEMTFDEKITDLNERADLFLELDLPGQPQMMHMGTAYLVRDLLKTLKEVTKQLKAKP